MTSVRGLKMAKMLPRLLMLGFLTHFCHFRPLEGILVTRLETHHNLVEDVLSFDLMGDTSKSNKN